MRWRRRHHRLSLLCKPHPIPHMRGKTPTTKFGPEAPGGADGTTRVVFFNLPSNNC